MIQGLLRHALLGLIVLLVIGLVAIIVFRQSHEPVTPEMDEPPPVADTPADLVMENVDYTETREGVRRWNLKAPGAQYNTTTGETLVKDVNLTVFDAQEKDLYYLTAQNGRMMEGNGTIEFWGNVVITGVQGERCRTERLTYQSETGLVTTDQPVELSSPGKTLTGVGMIFDVKKDRFQLKSQVKARIISDLRLGK